MIKDLMAEAIESRFGFVDRVPNRIEWLADNGAAYTAQETCSFAKGMGLTMCSTPTRSPESNGLAEDFYQDL